MAHNFTCDQLAHIKNGDFCAVPENIHTHPKKSHWKLPVPKFKKGLGISVHIVKITSYQKITQPPEISLNSETQRLVQNVILKLEKINMVLVKPGWSNNHDGQNSSNRNGYVRDTYMYLTFP